MGLRVCHNDFRIWAEDREGGGHEGGEGVGHQDGLKPPDCSCGLHLLQVAWSRMLSTAYVYGWEGE